MVTEDRDGDDGDYNDDDDDEHDGDHSNVDRGDDDDCGADDDGDPPIPPDAKVFSGDNLAWKNAKASHRAGQVCPALRGGFRGG